MLCESCNGLGRNIQPIYGDEPKQENKVDGPKPSDVWCDCCGRPWHRCSWRFDEKEED